VDHEKKHRQGRNKPIDRYINRGVDVMITIFAIFANVRRKNWRFSKKQCYDINLAKISSSSWSKKAAF
jgi:hypothetical protein